MLITCLPGYRLVTGRIERMCLHTAQWSGLAPVCQGKTQNVAIPCIITLCAVLCVGCVFIGGGGGGGHFKKNSK